MRRQQMGQMGMPMGAPMNGQTAPQMGGQGFVQNLKNRVDNIIHRN